MTKVKIFLIMTLAICNVISAKAQSLNTRAFDDLGIWCYITIDLNNDQTEDGYYRYKIPTPPEGVVTAQGPCAPHVFNNLGSTFELGFRKMFLLTEMEFNYMFTVDLLVNKWTYGPGKYTTIYNGLGTMCHYTVVVNIMK